MTSCAPSKLSCWRIRKLEIECQGVTVFEKCALGLVAAANEVVLVSFTIGAYRSMFVI
jgi:hypothetical protein